MLHVDLTFEDLRLGIVADEHEHTKGAVFGVGLDLPDLTGLDIFNDHAGQNVIALELFNDGIPHKLHLGVGESLLLDGLGCSQLVSSVDQSDLAAELCQVHSLFHSAVAAAYHIDVEILKEVAIAGGAVGNALAGQFLLAGAADGLGRSAGGDDDSLALILGLAALDHLDVAFQLHIHNGVKHLLSAEVVDLVHIFLIREGPDSPSTAPG